MSAEAASPVAPKRHGCFFYGCLTLVILAVLAGVAAFFTVRYAANRFYAYVEKYTDSAPAPLPKVEFTRETAESLNKRLEDFKRALETGTAVDPLVLTGDELNVLLASSPELKSFRDQFYFTIQGDQIRGQVSVPMEGLARIPGFSGLKGRYLNGTAAVRSSLANGNLVVNLESLEVKGQALPDEVMAGLKQQNLAEEATRNPELAEILRKLESIEVKDGKLVIDARATR